MIIMELLMLMSGFYFLCVCWAIDKKMDHLYDHIQESSSRTQRRLQVTFDDGGGGNNGDDVRH